jgi:uncharacterized protein (DUF2237 family)
MDGEEQEHNVLGTELRPCSGDPETGFLRDGVCHHLERDPGRHEVCAVMTADFLEFTAAQGNDLSTPRPDLNFPGLDPGDRWCVCVGRWIEAERAGKAPPVVLEATAAAVTEDVPLATLEAHAHGE